MLDSSSAIARKLTLLGGSMSVLGFKAVQMSADFNMTKKSFEVLTGSAEKAKEHLDDLQKFASQTPFNLPQLVDASKKLQAYGFQVEKVIPMLTDLGDASMALGLQADGMDRLTLAIGCKLKAS